MIDRYTHKKITWLDVINPTSDEIRDVIDEVGIPTSFAHDLTAMTPYSDAQAQKGVLKITLDFPIVKRTDINHPHEIKFIATKSHLVTIRFEDIEAINRFRKEFEVLGILTKRDTLSGITLCVSLMTYLYESLHQKLNYLETRLQDIEEEIFSEHEKEMVFEISRIGRRIIGFRQTLLTHERPLQELPAALETAFTKKARAYASTIVDYHTNVTNRIRSIQRTLEELRDTNMALLTTKQNETMKLFTIMAFITFPLTLFTSMFGMNTIATPIVGTENDFWLILGIMAFVSIGFFAYFRYKKWM